VLFTAYPAARRQLDFPALKLRAFEPGAVIALGDTRHVLSDPARDPDSLWPSLKTDVVPALDKFRTWRLSGEIGAKPVDALLDTPDQSTLRFLKRRGFSDEYLDRFLRPFFGGIFLDRSLQTSARVFQFVWKMLIDGETAVPARGMGAISEQLAAELFAADAIRLNTGVERLKKSRDNRVAVRA
jgi:phytoene dehydrogenase-like protein